MTNRTKIFATASSWYLITLVFAILSLAAPARANFEWCDPLQAGYHLDSAGEGKLTYTRWATPAKDQCSSGTCWAHAMSGANPKENWSESYLVARHYQELAEFTINSIHWNHRKVPQKDIEFSDGANFNSGLYLVAKYGHVRQRDVHDLIRSEEYSTVDLHNDLVTVVKDYRAQVVAIKAQFKPADAERETALSEAYSRAMNRVQSAIDSALTRGKDRSIVEIEHEAWRLGKEFFDRSRDRQRVLENNTVEWMDRETKGTGEAEQTSTFVADYLYKDHYEPHATFVEFSPDRMLNTLRSNFTQPAAFRKPMIMSFLWVYRWFNEKTRTLDVDMNERSLRSAAKRMVNNGNAGMHAVEIVGVNVSKETGQVTEVLFKNSHEAGEARKLVHTMSVRYFSNLATTIEYLQ